MQTTAQIAKQMEKDIRCPKCNGHLKFDTFFIDNVEIEPIKFSCKKCKYTFFEKVTTQEAIAEAKKAYSRNSKVLSGIIKYLKDGMTKGIKFKKR
jgi:C4-type Zn-finger protein